MDRRKVAAVAGALALALAAAAWALSGGGDEPGSGPGPGPGPGPGTGTGTGTGPGPGTGTGSGPGSGPGTGPGTGTGNREPEPGSETETETETASASAPLPAPGPRTWAGSLSRESIRDEVRESLPFFRFCFEWELARHPELAGRVTMEFVIDEEGHVAEARVAEDQLHSETVARCFEGVTSRMEFPRPEGGRITVRYPFVLNGAPPAERPQGI
jgi:hypothetical protein